MTVSIDLLGRLLLMTLIHLSLIELRVTVLRIHIVVWITYVAASTLTAIVTSPLVSVV